MSTDRIFIAFALVVGIAVGGVIVLVPQSRAIGLAPYFWVLIAFALFEGQSMHDAAARRGPRSPCKPGLSASPSR